MSHQTVVEQAERQIGTQLEESVVHVGERLDEFILSRTNALKSLVTDPDLSSEDHELISKQLASFIYSFPDFNEVAQADADGMIVASSYRPNVGNLYLPFSRTLKMNLGLPSAGRPVRSIFPQWLTSLKESERLRPRAG